MAELRRSADILGVSRVSSLGYADSGLPPHEVPSTHRAGCASSGADVDEAAERLAAILREEDARTS